jgi:hypothetical protein
MEILSLSLEFKNQLKILDQVILVPTSFHLWPEVLWVVLLPLMSKLSKPWDK